MGAASRLGLFAVALAIVFGASFAVGRAVDTGDDGPATTTVTTTHPHGADG